MQQVDGPRKPWAAPSVSLFQMQLDKAGAACLIQRLYRVGMWGKVLSDDHITRHTCKAATQASLSVLDAQRRKHTRPLPVTIRNWRPPLCCICAICNTMPAYFELHALPLTLVLKKQLRHTTIAMPMICRHMLSILSTATHWPAHKHMHFILADFALFGLVR